MYSENTDKVSLPAGSGSSKRESAKSMIRTRWDLDHILKSEINMYGFVLNIQYMIHHGADESNDDSTVQQVSSLGTDSLFQ